MAEAQGREGRRLRLVYMGTPEFAAKILARVLEWDGGEVVGVYTQPDRPCGRGRECKPSAVKLLALEHGLPIFQPENFKSAEAVDELKALAPDLLLVAAYGLILPQAVLDVPAIMPVNVHASLLPKYRGAAPIQRVLLDGGHVTGVTIMQMEAGLDSGPMLLQRALRISDEDTAETLHDQLADMGGRMLAEVLEMARAGKLAPRPQDHELATHASKLEKEEGRIDFSRPASEVHNRARAMHPWPGAFFDWRREDGKTLKLTIHPGRVGAELTEDEKSRFAPGEFMGMEGCELAVACADRRYLISRLVPQGKKLMDAAAFACGYLNRCSEAAEACPAPPDLG